MYYDLTKKRVFVAGHRGMVGAAIVRRLKEEGCSNILTVEKSALDLRSQKDVHKWIESNNPQAIFIAAAAVGGINANNSYPVDFLYNNVMIACNIIHAAVTYKVEKLLFLGSSCIYPKFCEQPIKESALLTGALEPTNEAYAIAKITGIKLCQAYKKQYGANLIVAMPTNLYGPGDNFDLNNSHVIPALIKRMHDARFSDSPTITVWGTGTPLREFLYVDDCADALVHLMKYYSDIELVNIGSSIETSIAELVQEIKSCLGFSGQIIFDTSKNDGTPRKLLDSSRIKSMGWISKTSLKEGIIKTYQWFCENIL